jgi:hypothetical protein
LVIAFTALFFLFCGYFLNSHSIPVAWKWMNTISTIKYPYEGLLMNEFRGDRVFSTDPIKLTGDDILRRLAISVVEDRKRWMVLYLVLRFASRGSSSVRLHC